MKWRTCLLCVALLRGAELDDPVVQHLSAIKHTVKRARQPDGMEMTELCARTESIFQQCDQGLRFSLAKEAIKHALCSWDRAYTASPARLRVFLAHVPADASVLWMLDPLQRTVLLSRDEQFRVLIGHPAIAKLARAHCLHLLDLCRTIPVLLDLVSLGCDVNGTVLEGAIPLPMGTAELCDPYGRTVLGRALHLARHDGQVCQKAAALILLGADLGQVDHFDCLDPRTQATCWDLAHLKAQWDAQLETMKALLEDPRTYLGQLPTDLRKALVDMVTDRIHVERSEVIASFGNKGC